MQIEGLGGIVADSRVRYGDSCVRNGATDGVIPLLSYALSLSFARRSLMKFTPYIYNMRKFLSFTFLLLLPFTVKGQTTDTEHNQAFARQLRILNRVLSNLDSYYVDTLDVKKIVDDGIDYMLYHLDPYTQYIPKEESEEFLEQATGTYAGIGSPIIFRSDLNRCVFSFPYAGMPAEQAGVRTGDVILEIDGEDVKRNEGEQPRDYSSRITSLLRGDAGTTFKLGLRRPGVEEKVELMLTRRVIQTPSVDYYGMLNDEVGVIVVNSFMENTTRDVRRAFVALKQQGMQRLLLDLRGNPGGLLSQAVGLVGCFVPNGTKVVSTKGKLPEYDEEFITDEEPLDTEIPLAVLVDYGSASSSEITAGALQDYDRAIIVGERTYGKGVVQQTVELPYEGILKFTASKYYIPSGRCIQAYDFKNRNEDGYPKHLPDSLAKTFYTTAGRPVKDGGGVVPDFEVRRDTVSDFVYELLNANAVVDFVATYRNTRPQPDFTTFAFSDADYSAFKEAVKASSFEYKSSSLRMLDTLEKQMKAEAYEAKAEIAALRQILQPSLDESLERYRKEITMHLTDLIIASYVGSQKVIPYKFKHDKVLKRGQELLEQQ